MGEVKAARDREMLCCAAPPAARKPPPLIWLLALGVGGGLLKSRIFVSLSFRVSSLVLAAAVADFVVHTYSFAAFALELSCCLFPLVRGLECLRRCGRFYLTHHFLYWVRACPPFRIAAGNLKTKCCNSFLCRRPDRHLAVFLGGVLRVY
jgi:hypothetical protein